MKLIRILPVIALALAATFACTRIEEAPVEVTVLEVGLPDAPTKTYMGASTNGERKVYWSEGDCLSLNGTSSNPLSNIGQEAASAEFTFPGVLNLPYNLLYPASFYKDEDTITLPATQTWVSGTFAQNTAPMCAYKNALDGQITISHLCAILGLRVTKDAGVEASRLVSVTFSGNDGEQVCGDFTLDYSAATLTGEASGSVGRSVALELSQPLTDSELELYLVVPARTYGSGFTVVLKDEFNREMTKVKSTSVTLAPGHLTKMTAFSFTPSPYAFSLDLDPIEEDVVVPDNTFNVIGRVVDTSNNPIEGAVVSDGTKCVKTMVDGTFYIESDIADVKFVFVSTPSGYMPQVVNGIPKFYKAKADITPSGGVYDFGDYVLTPVSNPNRYTLLITADPQPRANNWGLDKIAYKALEVCEDLYDELADVAAGITDRQVYGICLGDIVHENMSLFDNYDIGLARLGYPTYNIIGNHDNNPDAANDDESAVYYESHYGPRNYSFNIGGIHYVMLDNLIMKDNGEGKLTAFDQGLTDKIWTWLQNDMAFVPTDTKLMVCAHSPMYKLLKGSERTNSAYHAGTRSDKDGGAFGYADLFNQYPEIHAWAGHTHVGFNYVYPSSHRHRKVQVHTLARSTGELWTNEYLAAGTPRGFTIVEVDNGNISWKFHPVTRQRGSFQGASTGYCSAGAPAYDWRDWNYSNSIAVMKVGGGALTEEYQLHAYPCGVYGDEYVYANVFLWDENWELPVWTPDGGSPVTMTRLVTPDTQMSVSESADPIKEKIYDAADTEFRTWYKTYADHSGASLKGLTGYRPREIYSADGYLTTIFRAPADASPNSGTVSVTDRFGNTYTRRVSW